MRVWRPSLFAIVSLLVLLGLGVWVNLVIAHKPPPNYGPQKNKEVRFITESPSPSDPVRWPTIPDAVLEELGTPSIWTHRSAKTYRLIEVHWHEQESYMRDWAFLQERRSGVPFTARSTQNYFAGANTISPFQWELKAPIYQSEATTYYPLGLIVNPIVYALPPWLLLIIVRHRLLQLRTYRRTKRGLCPQCAYDIQDLPTCPECGGVQTSKAIEQQISK